MSGGRDQRVAYIDSSAYVKLVLEESESTALMAELVNWPVRVSSGLVVVEAVRACARHGEHFAARAEAGLGTLSLLPVDQPTLQAAARLAPSGLRSLDAVHLATALAIRDRLGALFSYDDRLGEAAAGEGIPVRAPA